MQLDVSWITDGSFKLANEIRKEKKEGGDGRKREERREGKGKGDLEEEEREEMHVQESRCPLIDGPF